MTGSANHLQGLTGMHHDLVLAYKTEAAFIRSKIDKAETVALSIHPNSGEPFDTIRQASLEAVQYLEGIIEPMEEVIAKMEAFTPTEWAAGLVDARDTIRAAKSKFPKIFKKESK